MFFMTPRRVASPRLARRVAFALRRVELSRRRPHSKSARSSSSSSSTANQLRHKQRPRATTLTAAATEAATATDKAKRAFLYFGQQESRAHARQTYALFGSTIKCLIKPFRLVPCRRASKIEELIKCARRLERECCI